MACQAAGAGWLAASWRSSAGVTRGAHSARYVPGWSCTASVLAHAT